MKVNNPFSVYSEILNKQGQHTRLNEIEVSSRKEAERQAESLKHKLLLKYEEEVWEIFIKNNKTNEEELFYFNSGGCCG